MRRRWLIGLVVVGTIVAVVFGGAFAFQRKLIYLPSGGQPPSAAEILPGGRDVTFTTDDGLRLAAWYFPVPDARATVLVAPGNAGNRSVRVPLARALTGNGLSVLLLDYRGFGGNPGSPTEEGLKLDARAAWRFLVREAGVSPGDLVYFGESLGAAVVSELAVRQPPKALVLRSPFTDLAAVAKRHYPFLPVRMLLLDTFPVVEYVSRERAPVTVVYGTADSIVPAEQSEAVADAAGATVVEVPGADHNDMALLDGRLLIDAIVEQALRPR
ncbi:alpha/beta superfamily hydrolase [Saccharomonospora marina XMU15]|uniref:Alpha/beta superfamily hydrolase n=1 Tax=Saccharomonospora marina XMU15 TaxID=882083 RepID=H5X1A8_9PSEU|nr:alpha/beta fold hydrolase [Saccharomonospora marina]EHR48632.1 alpha/beta superfamily hydrolase [Saccharomonospora marina XMU15]